MNQINIGYPAGAFGNFLSYLLNYVASGKRNAVKESVYDFVTSDVTYFTTKDSIINNSKVYINVESDSYLKYLVTNINRTGGIDLILEDLHIDTFDKIRSHQSLCFFEDSLKNISGQVGGNVSIRLLREWLRLCFFTNNGKTITEYIGPKPQNCYVVDFETFFSRDKIKNCVFETIKSFDLTILVNDIDDVIDEFFSKQYYKNHVNTNNLTNAIQKNQNISLNLNLVEQAWLDNWLVEQYKIDPRLCDDYFNSTKELIDFYNLPVDTN